MMIFYLVCSTFSISYSVLPLHLVSVQFSSVTQLCPTLCDPMNCSMPGLPVYHQLPEFTQTHVHWVSHAIQPSHPLSSPAPPALNPSQHQSLFQWVNSLHEAAKVLAYNPAIPVLGLYPEKATILKYTCTPMFIAALFVIAGTWSHLDVHWQMNG